MGQIYIVEADGEQFEVYAPTVRRAKLSADPVAPVKPALKAKKKAARKSAKKGKR